MRREASCIRRAAAVASIMVAATLWPTGAKAWECGRVLDNAGTPSGPGLLWTNRSMTYAFSTAGTQALPQEAARAAVRAAFAVWQAGAPRAGEPDDCSGTAKAGLPTRSDIAFVEAAPSDQEYVGYNYLNPQSNRNMVFFRDVNWPHPLTAPTSDLIGTTTVTYNNITGEILDADIEFNSADFTLSLGDDAVTWDLLNTAVHEVGHFLGFADSKAVGSAMFGTTVRGETTKRTLSCDDAAILWYRYPAGAKSATCNKFRVDESCGFCAPPGFLQFTPNLKIQDAFDGRSGCSCHSSQGAQGFGLALVTLMGRAARRRLRRR